MFNKSMIKRSVSNGIKEITTGELTMSEQQVGLTGVGVAMAGGVVLVTGMGATVVAKGMVVGGIGMVVGVIGKGFIRGFREQWASMEKTQSIKG